MFGLAEENYSMNLTTSTLNILISKYATYIKSNNISQDYQLITNSAAKTAAATVEVGGVFNFTSKCRTNVF